MSGAEFEAIKGFLQLEMRARYTGTRYQEVLTPDGWMKGSEIILADGVRRRIEFGRDSDKYGEVIVEDGKQRQHFFAATNEIHIAPKIRDEFRRRMGKMGDGPPGKGIKVSAKDGGRVAGRPTKLVSVTDDRGNPLQKMWFDPAKGVMLKREGYDFTGRRISLMEFRKINFDVKPSDSDFTIRRAGATIVRPIDMLVRASKRTSIPALRLNATELQLEGVMTREFRGTQALVSMYGSATGRVTLFVMKGPIDGGRLDRAGRGPSSTHKWTYGGFSCILVGPFEKSRLEAFSRTLSEVKK